MNTTHTTDMMSTLVQISECLKAMRLNGADVKCVDVTEVYGTTHVARIYVMGDSAKMMADKYPTLLAANEQGTYKLELDMHLIDGESFKVKFVLWV